MAVRLTDAKMKYFRPTNGKIPIKSILGKG